MITSSLSHPTGDRHLVIRQWQLEAAGGACGAALLSFFDYGHTWRLAASLRGGDGLWQSYTDAQLKVGLLELYSEATIRKSVSTLKARGFLSIRGNPTDNRQHYLFEVENVATWLSNYHVSEGQ